MISAFVHRLLDRLGVAPEPEPAVIARQAEWYDASRARIARMHATDLAIAKERARIGRLVGVWASDTVAQRHRATFPRVVGRNGAAIALWLPGLTTAEIMKIASSPALDVEHHLYGGQQLAGVRPVQPLEPCLLFWPRPSLNADQQAAAAGGGPRRR